MLAKLHNFFTIGGNDDDAEEYQAIHGNDGPATYGTHPYINEEIMESHNLSERQKSHHSNDSEYGNIVEKYQTSGGSSKSKKEEYQASMIVHLDEKGKHHRNHSHHSNSNGGSNGESSRTHGRIDTSMISQTDSDSLLSDATDITNLDSKSPPLLGMILVTISAVCYAALNLSVKALMDETPWQELMIIRMGITWAATMIWILYQYRGQMSLWGPKDKRLLLLWRAFFLWGAMFCCWWSFEFLPVGDGTTLAMSFPVWVTVIAHFVFKSEENGINADSNKLDKIGWGCVFGGLIGVIFVAQPSFIFGGDMYGPARDIGVILGLCSAVCAGSQYVIVNYTKEDCHWLQVEQITAFFSTFVFMPAGFVIFATVKYYRTGHFDIGWEPLSAFRWAEEVALGLLGFAALALLTRGSQLDAPARTAICLYLQIPMTYAGQCLMTKQFPDMWVFIGIALVLTAVILPAVRKLRQAKAFKLLQEKERMETRQRRRLAREQQDLASDVSSDSDASSGEGDNDDKPLLNRSKSGHSQHSGSYHSVHSKSKSRHSTHSQLGVSLGADITEVPKYTINVSNGSIGGRNGRKKNRRKSYQQGYEDYQSSSSDGAL